MDSHADHVPAAARVAVAGGAGVTGRHVVTALRRKALEPVVLSPGTGVAGRAILTALAARGHNAVFASRTSGVDVVSGQGLASFARLEAHSRPAGTGSDT